MEWLNIHRSTIEGEAMQDAPGHQPRTWLFLSVYCAGQENGGRIEGAAAWTDRKWMKLTSLTLEEVKEGSGLWTWEGEDLRGEFYPREQETVLRSKRKGGREGGKKRAENLRRFKGEVEGMSEGVLEGVLEGEAEAEAEGVLQRKGREGKEKKGKEREASRPGEDV